MEKKNLIIGQSGGPSAAINATLAGALSAAAQSEKVGKVYGAFHGIEGVLHRNLIDLTDFRDFEKLAATPAMALGSCRRRLPEDLEDPIYPEIEARLRELGVGWMLYTGGNDSMDTVHKLSSYFAHCKALHPEEEFPIVYGLPKTVDNDLWGCDHTPGYGSAARYLAVTVRELIRDTAIYAVPSVTVIEVMGRDAGWLTLAAGLPRFLGEGKPDIIALPELPFDEEAFLEQIRQLHKTTRSVIAVVSEGIRDESGAYVGAGSKSGVIDPFGHAYLSGVGKYLERLIKQEIGCKVRSIELSLMQRCSSHIASGTDLKESFAVGSYGAQEAISGVSGRMAVILRDETPDGSYRASYGSVDVASCAGHDRLVPAHLREVYDEKVQKEIVRYLLPVIQGEPPRFLDENGLPDYVDWLRLEGQAGEIKA